MDQVAIAALISFALIITGVAGLLLPALPGALFIWLGIVAYGLLAPGVDWSIWFYVIQGLLALSTYVIDYLATIWGVKKFKGTKAGAIGAVLGMLLVFVIGPLGMIIGPFIGAIIGELLVGGELRQALTSGFGSFVGFIVAAFLRLLICGIMISWFLAKVIASASISFTPPF
ncbi:MAG: DUF456 domain-containing protein [Thermodesulfobacteria bacterium]|nr:DUF456 domain-containing protein [Thermodesulfobacteriota bacterium]